MAKVELVLKRIGAAANIPSAAALKPKGLLTIYGYFPCPFPLDCHCPLLYVVFVPNASKNAGQTQTPPAKTPGMPFEEALKKLESIVEAMESEDLPLETLLAKYEEGTRLARICQEKLSEAEVKIQQLERTAAGEVKLKPLALPQNSGE